MYCVWHSIKCQSTTTGQHPQCWTETGTWSILHQPSLQHVHEGQRNSFGGKSVEAVHALLSENSCLHWQPSTSCPTWIWPNHKRSVSFQTKWKSWHDSTPDPTRWSQGRGSSDLCRDWCRNGLPLKMPSFPPGTHEYDPERHSLTEGVSKVMITREEARAKFHEYHNALGPHDEVYTDGSKINERVGAAAVINRHFQNGETKCRQLSERLPNNSTIFAAEATAITLALDYYRSMDPDVVVYSDSRSCLQAIEGEDTENPLICHIMNLLWALSDKGTHVRFCWVPSHCGTEGNEIVDQLAKETLDHDIDPLATVHYTDLKPVMNSYIQQEVQIKWDVYIHGRDLYLLKPTLGPPEKFNHLTRAEEVVITRLRIGHTKATKSHILSRGPPTACQHCGQTLTIEHMLLECTVLQQIRDEYYTADSLRTLFETIPETCIVKEWTN